MTSLGSAQSSSPKRAANSCKSWRRMLRRYECLVLWASFTRKLGMQRFLEGSGESEQGRIFNSSQPEGQSFRVGLLLCPLSLWLDCRRNGRVELFHQLYSHCIFRSSQRHSTGTQWFCYFRPLRTARSSCSPHTGAPGSQLKHNATWSMPPTMMT